MGKKSFGILVGGGPAPGINGVISSATIEVINRGHKVFGISNGFELIAKGNKNCIKEFSIEDVSRIHSKGGSILGTSRYNPRNNPQELKKIIEILTEKEIKYLLTIGGDDTASSAGSLAEIAQGKICVGHVPKTIDNDLPLPERDSTFGFQSARSAGTEISETLMVDAKTTTRWYFMVTM